MGNIKLLRAIADMKTNIKLRANINLKPKGKMRAMPTLKSK